jgi:hypothetical protein
VDSNIVPASLEVVLLDGQTGHLHAGPPNPEVVQREVHTIQMEVQQDDCQCAGLANLGVVRRAVDTVQVTDQGKECAFDACLAEAHLAEGIPLRMGSHSLVLRDSSLVWDQILESIRRPWEVVGLDMEGIVAVAVAAVGIQCWDIQKSGSSFAVEILVVARLVAAFAVSYRICSSYSLG